MALSGYRIFYRKNGGTTACNLYTSSSEAGMSDSIKVYRGGTLYAPIAAVGDNRQSSLQCRKGGNTKSIWRFIINYIATWTQFGYIAFPNLGVNDNNKTVSASYSVYVDYNQIYSTGALHNIKITAVIEDGDNTGATPYCMIDGVTYNFAYSQGSTTSYLYFRLSTGSHTIVIYGYHQRGMEGDTMRYSMYGHRVVPA